MSLKISSSFIGLFFMSIAIAKPLPSSSEEALHLNWLDKSVAPGDNFYSYANGNWQKQNPIPGDYSSWSSFTIVNKKTQTLIHEMLIKAAADKQAKPGSIEQKIGDFYFSGMDEKTINALGAKPLQGWFDKITALKDLRDLQNLTRELQMMGVDIFFDISSMQDYKNSEEVIGVISQAGLGLPDRDYYLKNDKKFQDIREAYVKHIAKMFELLGEPADEASKISTQIMEIETYLAKASMSQIEQRDPNATYHIMNLKDIDNLTPNFSWSNYLRELNLANLTSLNVAMPEFFKTMDAGFKKFSLEQWKLYLRWHLIDAFAPYLSKPFVQQNFSMVSIMSGTKKLAPRWRRVVNTENSVLGFAIGKLYIEQHFSTDSKKQVMEILTNIRKVLEQDLETLSWMTPKTRKAALQKLDLMKSRVGYPNKWWDYSKLKVDRGPYVLNVIRGSQFIIQRDLNKIGKPVDTSEWAMTPQTMNAYYDPSMNSINLPAGILQSPFFDPKAPAAINYGAIGFVIGHELTHGFDDQGAKFDGKGNLSNWWTKEDLEKFQAATNCIVELYSTFTIDGSMYTQGKLVVGEATADLGGLTLAYRAFLQSKDYKEAKNIQGFSPEQQFFLGAAHVWASNIRKEEQQNQITTDPHPLMQFRVNGTFSNMTEFAKAYGIKAPAKMVRIKPCIIW